MVIAIPNSFTMWQIGEESSMPFTKLKWIVSPTLMLFPSKVQFFTAMKIFIVKNEDQPSRHFLDDFFLCLISLDHAREFEKDFTED